MSDQEAINVAGVTFIPKRAKLLLTALGVVIGMAAGGGAQIALSKATLVDHGTRIGALEASDVKKTEHDTKRDAQWDDLLKGIDKLTTAVEKQNDKLEALGTEVARGSRR
jgi:hypothetical protein